MPRRGKAELVDKRVAGAVPLSELVRLRLEGHTTQEIGVQYGITHQAVSKRLRGLWGKLEQDELEAFDKHRVPILRAAEREMIVRMLQPQVLKKANLRDLVIGFGTLYDKERLETGQSTANVALHSIVEAVERDRSKGEAPLDVVDVPSQPLERQSRDDV
jgi:hypothetical protein